MSPINNIVDITNFVLHEVGPTAARTFDADEEITGQKVIVKTLEAGTKFITLDNKGRTLSANDLMMICNAKESRCVLLVFSVESNLVFRPRQKISFLESACFSSTYVRKNWNAATIKKPMHRFALSEVLDPNITVFALKRAALLIKEIAGGQISSEIVDVFPNKIENQTIEVKFKNR